uniref:Uncharacterized protein n=1 Tax=Anguilla anguilla TaxID=7936 RepID=A0A0E9RKS4_ANGAN
MLLVLGPCLRGRCEPVHCFNCRSPAEDCFS